MSSNREVSAWKRRLLWLIFFGSFGFAGGGAFLLFGMVPLEHRLAVSGWSQPDIDQTLSFVVYGWVLFSFLAATVYSHLTLQSARPIAAVSLAGLMALAASFVFHEFLHGKSLMMAGRTAKIEEVSQRFSFGPYPDKDELKLLKEQGYDGIISLLHPVIPFEEVLLEEEKKNGAELGLKVYSFPMLPWISENKAALAGIQKLIQQSNERYYVHCYLGQHRANLVRRMAGYGSSAEEAGENHELPDHLERGQLFSYEGTRIVVGPFPSDEEWFGIILRHGIREVVSTLNPNNPEERGMIGKMKQISQDYNFVLTERPLDRTAPDPGAVQRLAEYLKKDDRKVYVVGSQADNWALELDKALGGREALIASPLGQDMFTRGPLMTVNDSVVLGPYPTDAEVEVLKKAGVRAVVSLLDNDQTEWIAKEARWAQENHFVLKRFPLKPSEVTRGKLEDISVYLFNQPGLTYVHTFRSDNTLRELQRTMRRMIRE
ncbi:MAG TPA: hypothetical protein VGQ94_01290 [Terriglobales bacterium]|nr:hypothetical protein [Terriglobales bacterium]